MPRRNIYATEEQWAVVDRLAGQDAAVRRSERNVSRLLVELALAEDTKRAAQSVPLVQP